MRFATYNLLNYGTDPERADLVHQAIGGLMTDADAAGDGLVLAVQELIADGDDKESGAGRVLQDLGKATGLECLHRPNEPAVAVGNHRFYVGLLWTPGIEPARDWAPTRGRTCGTARRS